MPRCPVKEGRLANKAGLKQILNCDQHQVRSPQRFRKKKGMKARALLKKTKKSSNKLHKGGLNTGVQNLQGKREKVREMKGLLYRATKNKGGK